LGEHYTFDFMFQLTKAETEDWQRLKRLRSQIVTLKKTRGTHRQTASWLELSMDYTLAQIGVTL